MIRDPSDGTVKEITPESNQINVVTTKPASKEITLDTGLRQPTRTDAQVRLEESRKWLKDYHAKKEREHADGADTKADAGLRSGSAGLEQQGDCSEARDQPAHRRGSPS